MTRQIEWIGQKSLFADPRVEYALASGKLSERQVQILRNAARLRNPRVEKRTIRTVRKRDIAGLTRSYRFGPDPGSYVQAVEDGDARLLLECGSRDEFRDVTEGVPAEPIVLPQDDIQVVRREHFGSVEAFNRAMAGRP